jgi:hypothetical protein
MSYIITKSNGDPLVTIQDGFIDNTTGLALPGPNYVGYGGYLNENLIHLLDNFAADHAPPGVSLPGQLWYDTFNDILNVYTGQAYIPVSGVSTQGQQPTVSKDGDIWFNTITEQTKVYFGGQWKLVGPTYTKQQGVSGAVPLQIGDAATNNVTHNLVSLQYGGQIVAILSSDPIFTPSPPIFGFPTITPGITFANSITNASYRGTITGNVASLYNGQVVINTAPINTIFTGNLVGNVAGNVVGNIVGNIVGNVTGSVTGNVVSTTISTNTLTASTVTATQIGSTGTQLSGTLSSGPQTNITAVGPLTGLQVGSAQTGATTNLYGSAYLNGVALATVGGSASFTAIDNTPIGQSQSAAGTFTTLRATQGINSTSIGVSSPSTGWFTTLNVSGLSSHLQQSNFAGGLTASTVQAATIGNTGATITGTLSTGSQTNINAVGTINSGTWNADIISSQKGGTGVNNGYKLTILSGDKTLNQDVSNGASPTFNGANFTGIPATAITGGVGSGGGGSITGVTPATTTTSGLTLTGGGTSGGVTLTLGGSLSYTAVVNALGYTPYNGAVNANGYITSGGGGFLTASGTLTGTVSTSNSCTTGALSCGNLTGSGWGRFSGDVTAFYSDRRLKTDIAPITGALDKVLTLSGVQYRANDVAGKYGFDTTKQQVGVLADQILVVQPEAVAPAPFDTDENGNSISGENYLTVKYEKLVPLLLEAIKDLNAKVEALEARLAKQ